MLRRVISSGRGYCSEFLLESRAHLPDHRLCNKLLLARPHAADCSEVWPDGLRARRKICRRDAGAILLAGVRAGAEQHHADLSVLLQRGGMQGRGPQAAAVRLARVGLSVEQQPDYLRMAPHCRRTEWRRAIRAPTTRLCAARQHPPAVMQCASGSCSSKPLIIAAACAGRWAAACGAARPQRAGRSRRLKWPALGRRRAPRGSRLCCGDEGRSWRRGLSGRSLCFARAPCPRLETVALLTPLHAQPRDVVFVIIRRLRRRLISVVLLSDVRGPHHRAWELQCPLLQPKAPAASARAPRRTVTQPRVSS